MVETNTVESECLPISGIPHTSRLFQDYLHHFDQVRSFYARGPRAESWWKEERELIRYPEERRQKLASILERQNRAFGAGQKTLENIERFRRGAAAVVTGQQVGLFGGPVFCLLKALTSALLAEKTGNIPIFWVATEDHDLAEINGVNLPETDHLKRITLSVPHVEGAPVGAIAFGDEVAAAVQQIEGLFGQSEMTELLATAYRKGETFGSAFAKFYAQIFAELGIVLLDPLDADVHKLARPLFRSALDKAEQINQALAKRGEELATAGYHAQVNVTPSHTLCFYLEDGARDGARTPIRHEGAEFVIGQRRISREELLREAEGEPERFSANVLLRPVLQDYLLPTLCYVGGPAEIAYFAQVETVYRHLAARVTPVVPRISATLIEPRQSKLLDRYGLKLTDAFVPPEKLKEIVAAHALPESVTESFDQAAAHLEQALATIRSTLGKLDKTLVDAAEHSAGKMRYQLQSLRDKAARAEARKNDELQRHAAELSTMLYPNKELQEREIGALYFLMKYGKGFVVQLKALVDGSCVEHQVIRIGK
jgi:bacillithiol synthase